MTTLPEGKAVSWTDRTLQCLDSSFLFRSYYGDGIVEKQGCTFNPVRLSNEQFRVDGECKVRGISRAESRSIIEVYSERSLDMRVSATEDDRKFKVEVKATWLAECPRDDSKKSQ